MQSADISVVPTGGSTAIDLADLAAAVLALQANAHAPALAFWSFDFDTGSDQIFMNVAKQTGVIESLAITIDGDPVTTSSAIANLPDGLYGVNLTSVLNTPGTHTVQVQGAISGAVVSTTYTV